MNTPAHALVNLLLLARKPGARAAIVAGALIADLAMVVLRLAFAARHPGTADLAAAAWLYRRAAELRAGTLTIVGIYLAYWLYVYLVWL